MVKPKSFLPWNPEQTLLLPPFPVEWLPENHLVFVPLDLVAELDVEPIHAHYRQKDPRGEKACWEDAAFRVLTGNQQPDHSRISDSRRRHLDALAGLFVQVLRFWQKAGLVSLGQVVLDGTKGKANASRQKAMSHERMLKSERQLEAEMRVLLRTAELIDAQADGQYGKGKRSDQLPEELQRHASRLEWIRKAKAELEAEAAEQEAAEAEASGHEQRTSGLHAAAVAPASERRTRRNWPSRRSWPQAWNHRL